MQLVLNIQLFMQVVWHGFRLGIIARLKVLKAFLPCLTSNNAGIVDLNSCKALVIAKK